MDTISLFEEFSASNAAEWQARLSQDLKGITFEDLCQQDRNGITIAPFYTEEPEEYKGPLFSHQDWVIYDALTVDNNEEQANHKALQYLNSGASGLIFNCLATVDLNKLLQSISVAHIQLRFVLDSDPDLFVAALEQYLNLQQLKAQDIDCIVVCDTLAQSLSGRNIDLEQAKLQHLKVAKSIGVLAVDARLYQNAGANSITQLGYALAQINEYFFWAEQGGYCSSINKINVALANGTDFFEEIAKLRAMRILLVQLLQAYNCPAQIEIHVETSDTYRAPFDAYNNLLRDTLSAMSAVLGGCNSLWIHPFDQELNTNQELSTRMSRNQQLILKEESYLHQVADVASGSFYLEQLSIQLAEKAWTIFQEVERQGGYWNTLRNGVLQASIKQQAQSWIREYAEGKRVLIGINKFINPNDQPHMNTTDTNQTFGVKAISLTQEILKHKSMQE